MGAAALLAAGCGAGGDDEVVVFGASSLTDVLDELAQRYEADRGVAVVVNAAGSASLVAQLRDGAPADVLITADAMTMQAAAAADAVVEPVELFARNDVVIAVEAGNPLGLASMGDLADDDVVVVLAAPEVPAGAYAAAALECVGVDVRPASLEQSVRAAASKVALGEADAAIVYRTDVGGDIEAVEISEPCDVDAEYFVAGTGTANGADFVEFVRGPAGVAALESNGFRRP